MATFGGMLRTIGRRTFVPIEAANSAEWNSCRSTGPIAVPLARKVAASADTSESGGVSETNRRQSFRAMCAAVIGWFARYRR